MAQNSPGGVKSKRSIREPIAEEAQNEQEEKDSGFSKKTKNGIISG
jgi:hypothetical protein